MRKVVEGDTVHVIRRMPLKQSLDVIKGVTMRMRAHSAGEVLRGLREEEGHCLPRLQDLGTTQNGKRYLSAFHSLECACCAVALRTAAGCK